MSTNTRISFTPAPLKVKTDYTLTEDRAINLDGLLGSGGKQVVMGALETLANRSELLPGESQGILSWERVRDGGAAPHYRLKVPAEHLPGLDGLEGLTVSLRMRGPVTEVTHEAQFSRTDERAGAAVPTISTTPQDRRAIQRAVNRSVNQLLAYSVATRIESKLKEQVKQKLNVRAEQRINQLVSMRMSNRINVQTTARLRSWR